MGCSTDRGQGRGTAKTRAQRTAIGTRRSHLLQHPVHVLVANQVGHAANVVRPLGGVRQRHGEERLDRLHEEREQVDDRRRVPACRASLVERSPRLLRHEQLQPIGEARRLVINPLARERLKERLRGQQRRAPAAVREQQVVELRERRPEGHRALQCLDLLLRAAGACARRVDGRAELAQRGGGDLRVGRAVHAQGDQRGAHGRGRLHGLALAAVSTLAVSTTGARGRLARGSTGIGRGRRGARGQDVRIEGRPKVTDLEERGVAQLNRQLGEQLDFERRARVQQQPAQHRLCRHARAREKVVTQRRRALLILVIHAAAVRRARAARRRGERGELAPRVGCALGDRRVSRVGSKQLRAPRVAHRARLAQFGLRF